MAAINQRLGEIMLEKGLVNEEQLTRALKSQDVMGGRLGTALVDIKLVTISTVSSCLAYQLGVPEASKDALLAVSDETLALMSRKLCARYKILPLRTEGRILHMAMRDPHKLDIVDEVAFSVGYRLQPYVVPEIRLYLYLEMYYDIPREKRFASFRDVDEVSTKPRKKLTKKSMFKLPRKAGQVQTRETTEHNRPAMITPPPVPEDAPLEEPPVEVPATPRQRLELVSLDSFTSREEALGADRPLLSSEDIQPRRVPEDQSKIPTQVTPYPETPPGEEPLSDDHADQPDSAAPPPLAHSSFQVVPASVDSDVGPHASQPPFSASRILNPDLMPETAEMYPVPADEETETVVSQQRPSQPTRQALPLAVSSTEPTDVSQLIAASQVPEPEPYEPSASKTDQGYPVVDQHASPSTSPVTSQGYPAVEPEPRRPEPEPPPRPEPRPEAEPRAASKTNQKFPASEVTPQPRDDEFEFQIDDGAAEKPPAVGSTSDSPADDDQAPLEEGQRSVEAIILRLEQAQTRDEVTRLLVSPFLAAGNLSVLFLVRQGNFMAMSASGTNARDEEVRAMVVSVTNPSLLQRAYKQQTVVRAPAESDPLHQMISAHLRVDEPEEVCVAPVVLAGRVVNLLCIQSLPGRRFDKDVARQLKQVCEVASASYKRLIHKTKK